MPTPELIALIGGPLLSILIALVAFLMWALKRAKAEGVKEARDEKIKADVDAAHKKIREDIMPAIEELQRARIEASTRMENIQADQQEMKGDIKTVLSVVQDLAIKIAESRPKGATT